MSKQINLIILNMNRLTAYVNGGQNKSGHCIKTIDLLNLFNGVLHLKKNV